MLIGITGGVGAGKSTVMHLLEKEYDTYLIVADDVARELQQKGRPVYEEIVRWLGEEIVDEQGELDRARLAKLVFSDETALKQLNAIVHPEVRKEILSQMDAHKSTHTHVAVEAALLIEERYDEYLDEIWFVDAPDDVRIARLMDSRGYSLDKCREIMKTQLERDTFAKHTDRVIDNSSDEAHIRAQLDKIFQQIS